MLSYGSDVVSVPPREMYSYMIRASVYSRMIYTIRFAVLRYGPLYALQLKRPLWLCEGGGKRCGGQTVVASFTHLISSRLGLVAV